MPHVSDEEVEDLIADLSKDASLSVGREKISAIENEIASSAENINRISSRLNPKALETLRVDGQERLSRQESNIKHYRELGFQIARTSIVVIGIIVSGVAILLQQGIITDKPDNFWIPTFGMALIGMSVLTGTFWPLLQSYYFRRTTGDTDDEFFNSLVPEKIEEGTEQNRFLVRILIQQAAIARINSTRISRLQISALASVYLLFLGMIIITIYAFIALF